MVYYLDSVFVSAIHHTLQKSTFQDSVVVATPNGSAYHQRSCSHLSRSKNLLELNVSQAADQGLHPCRTCMADA